MKVSVRKISEITGFSPATVSMFEGFAAMRRIVPDSCVKERQSRVHLPV